jgi:hypothetical protein
VDSIPDADLMATIGSVTGFGLLRCDLSPWDGNRPLTSHRLRERPAPVQQLMRVLFGWMATADQPTVDGCCRYPHRRFRRPAEKGPAVRTTAFPQLDLEPWSSTPGRMDARLPWLLMQMEMGTPRREDDRTPGVEALAPRADKCEP